MAPPYLPPFAALRAFDFVGRTGGIRKAAEALGVSHAIVSRHLSSLEALLGSSLLNRQNGELTDVGRAYHARITVAISEIEAATQSVRKERATGLTIWCSAGFALHWLTKHLSKFSAGRKSTIIDLRSTESEPDLDKNEADGDIRYLLDGASIPASRSIRMEEIARPLVFPVASPALLARLGRNISNVRQLKALPLIEEMSNAEWIGWLKAQGDDAANLTTPAARYGQAHLTLAAALAGQGVALSNHFLAADYLNSGSLVRIEPASEPFKPVALGAYIFRSSRSAWSDPSLERFRRWLRTTVAQETGVK